VKKLREHRPEFGQHHPHLARKASDSLAARYSGAGLHRKTPWLLSSPPSAGDPDAEFERPDTLIGSRRIAIGDQTVIAEFGDAARDAMARQIFAALLIVADRKTTASHPSRLKGRVKYGDIGLALGKIDTVRQHRLTTISGK
jgi:hypothetical protein